MEALKRKIEEAKAKVLSALASVVLPRQQVAQRKENDHHIAIAEIVEYTARRAPSVAMAPSQSNALSKTLTFVSSQIIVLLYKQ